MTPDQLQTLKEGAACIVAGCALLFVAAGLGTLTVYTPVLLDVAEWVGAAVSLAASVAAFVIGGINLKMALKGEVS